MKVFFWLSALAYVILYFYAAYIYEGFSMPVAIAIFVAVCGFFYWRHKRKAGRELPIQEVEDTSNVAVETKPMSLWMSPLPYIGIAALVVLVIGLRL